ncbi:NAD(P)H-hydrate epimerase [Candidatus Nanosalina sp. VS9-1]|uniref:NAD(P)H-hydrate epimerase n=1 Tax=Candidatus Nanosalina sp. VS9-1 TaxID=3388566 RepID=UPI0039E08F78
MEKASRGQLEELDRILPEDYGISVGALMEAAGYQVADFLRQEFSSGVKIAVICGRGYNGADGLVAARRLFSWGFEVEVFTPFDEEELSDTVVEKLEALKALDQSVVARDFPSASIYVDALIGYGMKGDLREPVESAAEKINDWSAETISIDVPTGLDIEAGTLDRNCVRPDYTVTFGALKASMTHQNSGEIYVADIGIPPQALDKVGLDSPDFFTQVSLVDIRDFE